MSTHFVFLNLQLKLFDVNYKNIDTQSKIQVLVFIHLFKYIDEFENNFIILEVDD